MACYKKRVDVALGHSWSTRVLLPTERIDNMQKSIKQLEHKITEHQRQFTEQQRQITELQQMNKHRLKMLRANPLVDLVKKLCGKSPVPSSPVQNLLGHDSSRLAIPLLYIKKSIGVSLSLSAYLCQLISVNFGHFPMFNFWLPHVHPQSGHRHVYGWHQQFLSPCS